MSSLFNLFLDHLAPTQAEVYSTALVQELVCRELEKSILEKIKNHTSDSINNDLSDLTASCELVFNMEFRLHHLKERYTMDQKAVFNHAVFNHITKQIQDLKVSCTDAINNLCPTTQNIVVFITNENSIFATFKVIITPLLKEKMIIEKEKMRLEKLVSVSVASSKPADAFKI